MRRLIAAAALAAGACSPEPRNRTAPVDIANAAKTPVVDEIRGKAGPSPVTAPAGAAGARAVVAETPSTPDSAQGAANVVQRYFALIEAGRYRDAWALWDDGGRASGMSAADFAASFAKYAGYHAEIGAPGRIDAGAGQRYVTVPVKAYGTLRAGDRPFAMQGDVTLHRAADIDGATPEQRQWRISASGLKPRPAAGGTPPRATARYRCTDGTRFQVDFDNVADTATILFQPQGEPVELSGQRPASGIWYAGGGYTLRGKGRDAQLVRPGGRQLDCRADG